MSQIRETNQGVFKSWKTFFSEKDFFSTFTKVVLSISLVMSIAFIFFSAFSNHSRWVKYPINTTTNNVMRASQKEKEAETNISHIVFGIGGSVKTWKDRKHYSELWWKPNVTHGYIWLDEKPDESTMWTATSPPYRISEDSSRFKYTNSWGPRSAVRMTRIVLETFRLGMKNVRWFVMGDDDTVFFTENLVMVLGKYDHNQMYYIGGNSESVEQDAIHSYGMAYGGGGIAISYPLVAELVKLLDGCIDRYSDVYGSDERIRACLDEIGVPLTKELGFHQNDIHGDPYGLLSAHPLAPLVSLHHLDYVDSLIPGKNQLDSLNSLISAYKLDPGRILQQSICYDLKRKLTISVSWGYAVLIYPSLLTAKDVTTPLQTFRTWKSWSEGPFTFNTRSMNIELCKQPTTYFLDHVGELGKQIQTSYKKFAGKGGMTCNRTDYVAAMSVANIHVTSLKMEQTHWKMAPRRQCSEIVKRNKGGVLHLRIRRCKTGESLTLP